MQTAPIIPDFYFSIFQDEIYAVRLVWQLARYFPLSKVIAISDGPCDSHSMYVASNFNPNLIILQGERLKHAGKGMEFTQRNLSWVLGYSQAEIIVKLDPDTYINRPCRFPNVDWFGDVKQTGFPFLGLNFEFIAGGCMGFRRHIIEMLIESEYLISEQLNKAEGFYDRYVQYKKFGDPNCTDLIHREDYAFGWCMKKLGVMPYQFDNCYCVQDEEQRERKEVAIAHPVRTIF
jgi:hypothetical protein